MVENSNLHVIRACVRAQCTPGHSVHPRGRNHKSHVKCHSGNRVFIRCCSISHVTLEIIDLLVRIIITNIFETTSDNTNLEQLRSTATTTHDRKRYDYKPLIQTAKKCYINNPY